MTSRRRKQTAPRRSASNIIDQEESEGNEHPSKRTRSSSVHQVSTRSQTQQIMRSTLKTKRSLKMKLKTKLKSKKVAKEKAAKAKMKEDQDRPPDIPKNRVLNLDQIRKLSDVALLKKFAEHRTEKSRKRGSESQSEHIYTCKLLPENCREDFKGTAAAAKQDMKRHLLAHIGELLTLSASDSAKANKLEFTSLEGSKGGAKARNEKEKEAKTTKSKPRSKPRVDKDEDKRDKSPKCNQDAKKYVVSGSHKSLSIELPKSADVQGSSFTVIKSSEGLNEVVLLPKGQLINLSTMAESFESSKLAKGVLIDEQVPPQRKTPDSPSSASSSSPQKQRHVPNILRRSRRVSGSPSKSKTGQGPGTTKEGRLTLSEFAQIVTEKVGFGDERLAAAFHDDHNYTIVQKKPQIPELMNTDADGRPVRPETSSQYIEMDSPPNYYEQGAAASAEGAAVGNNQDGYGQQQQLPGIGVSRAKPTRIKMSEVVRNTKCEVEKSDEDNKSKQIRLKALEILKSMRKRRAKADDGNSKGQFECEICGKLYTAGATLTAHYRSHAGIKPFQCQICKASFTRLHSLNYHMMIHNSQSRFTCDYCGRKFRHPSHFKEHLRRHTGEAPFACCDCPRRFKTRNTYKRHLRSKHGKVLTAKGITTMDGVPVVLVSTTNQPNVQSKSSPMKEEIYDDDDEEEDEYEDGGEGDEDDEDMDVDIDTMDGNQPVVRQLDKTIVHITDTQVEMET